MIHLFVKSKIKGFKDKMNKMFNFQANLGRQDNKQEMSFVAYI